MPILHGWCCYKKTESGQHSNLGNEMIKLTFNATGTQIALSKADRGGGGVARVT